MKRFGVPSACLATAVAGAIAGGLVAAAVLPIGIAAARVTERAAARA